MLRKNFGCLLLAAGVGLLSTGCMPKMTIEEMKAMRPQKPVELQQLNDFVGTWKGTGTCMMEGVDQPLKMSGTSTIEWAGDGWFLVEHGNYSMEEFGDMKGIGIWTYDAKAKKYRMTWADTMGGYATGTAKYNAATNTWHMKSKNYSAFGKSIGKGTTTVINNKMDWSWCEYAMGGLMKTMCMDGSSTKQ